MSGEAALVAGEGKAVAAAEADSWERLSGETNPAWNAFCLYRDYGADRSIKKVLALQGIPESRYGIWCAWSARFLWVKRLESFDPEELSQGNVIEWIRSSIEIEQEIYGKAEGGESSLCRQLEINFTEEFKGI